MEMMLLREKVAMMELVKRGITDHILGIVTPLALDR
jgi:hypothetical protein